MGVSLADSTVPATERKEANLNSPVIYFNFLFVRSIVVSPLFAWLILDSHGAYAVKLSGE